MPYFLRSCLLLIFFAASCQESPKKIKYNGLPPHLLTVAKDSLLSDSIIYHRVRINENGNILPWFSADIATAYDDVLKRVWMFWKNMEKDSNGQPYYMNHQVWRAAHDIRGLGGDQLMMALSSWDLYYNYTGDSSLIENMRYMADYYLAHSLSSSKNSWPDLPFPYNMNVESGIYDGDMILGKDYLQPDKAGSFGFELLHLYKKTGEQKYLDASIKIANTLADKVQVGDSINSPWPFKVNAVTGETGVLVEKDVWEEGMHQDVKGKKYGKKLSSYTTNWTATLGLFRELIALAAINTGKYQKAFDITIRWLQEYPAKTNKWGPFFEDVPRWSDTQINAITYATFLLANPQYDPNWKQTVNNIFNWVNKNLGDSSYARYGVKVTAEQTAYKVPGNSHTARQGSAALLYWQKTGDTANLQNAIRQLSWSTYMVDTDGKNFYPTNDIWLTDGYGDYVRHYLRAMAAAPELVPQNSSHLLHSSSIIRNIRYEKKKVVYTTFDEESEEMLRLTTRPARISVDGQTIAEVDSAADNGWSWESMQKGGVFILKKKSGREVTIED